MNFIPVLKLLENKRNISKNVIPIFKGENWPLCVVGRLNTKIIEKSMLKIMVTLKAMVMVT